MSPKFLFFPSQAAGAYLLDTYTGGIAAYSLRQLKTGVTDVIRVRRDTTGDPEQDFTPIEITDGTLTTFTSTDNGKTSKTYDQVATNHLIQETTTRQPALVESGVLNTLNR